MIRAHAGVAKNLSSVVVSKAVRLLSPKPSTSILTVSVIPTEV